MLKLTTYRRDQFPNLKAKLEADGYTYASAMELCSTQKLASLCSEGPVALDVSPLLPLLDPSSRLNDTASVTEVLMHQLPDDTLFVADENATAGREYDMRTLFDEIEKSEIEGEPAEKTMPVKRRAKLLVDLSSEKADKLLDDFDSNLIGQGPFKKELRKQVGIFRLFNSIGEQPILSMFLLGPSGVGKTETARILSDLLAPDQPLPKINFGNYSSNDSLNSLIGSPRGYIGSEEGELMKIEASESGVILIDEFEKANPAVWNFFLDLLESGHFTDTQGAMHDLNGYTIVFTSNAPKEEVREKFPPELLSRFGLKARFAPLSTEDKQAFVRRYIENVATKYQRTRNTLPHPDDVVNAALEGIDVSKEENIRVLKNEARKWFADYINECAGL